MKYPSPKNKDEIMQQNPLHSPSPLAIKYFVDSTIVRGAVDTIPGYLILIHWSMDQYV